MVKYFRIIYFLLILTITQPLYAFCNFSTGEYSEELQNPKSIKDITVQIHNIKKWSENSLKIIVTRPAKTINPKYRDNFKAKILINYDFGYCNFKGEVRQHGDYLDHIKLNAEGKVLASLDVKLKDGNILNAVHFKLLLPETRNSEQEVLGSLLLRELGYISPETFIVNADINGAKGNFLFQEKPKKELLERNLRKEGPLFEGDEKLLWSYKDRKFFELESVSLARLENANWAKKGIVSAQISMKAFTKLQSAYLEYANRQSKDDATIFIRPNYTINPQDKKFENYAFILLAMNGSHALRPHNRKFYFNTFTQLFEPIYYDGNLSMKADEINIKYYSEDMDIELILNSVKINDIKSQLIEIQNLNEDMEFIKKVENRVNFSLKEVQNLVNESLKNTVKNIKKLIKIKNNSNIDINLYLSKSDQKSNILEFLKRAKEFELRSDFVELTGTRKNPQISYIKGSTPASIKINDPSISSKLISKNKFNKTRTVVLKSSIAQQIPQIKNLKLKEGLLQYSIKSSVKIDFEKKEIVFLQNDPSNWLLIKNVNLDEWIIKMVGKLANSEKKLEQRFNYFGLTGCLNFYKVKFSNVKISATNGMCEDTLNIVSSGGNIKNIKIVNSYADGVDSDFSEINFKNIEISKSGNDCFDVSSGNYTFKNIKLDNCKDKGLSIGEMSKVLVDNFLIMDSNIAVTSKDSSITEIKKLEAYNVNTCVESYNKKQEFNGAAARISEMLCTGEIKSDKNSIVELNGYKQ